MYLSVTQQEVGKWVIDSNGEQVGEVERVEDGTALVDIKDDLDVTLIRALNWRGERARYPLRNQSIKFITSTAIYLRNNL